MQEINLLQNKVKDRTLQFERSNRFILILFVLALLLEVAAIGVLIFLTHSDTKKSEEVSKQSQAIQAAIDANQKDLTLAKGLQAQLKNVNNLIRNRVYWSAFLDQIASVTTNQTKFSSVSASVADKKLHIEGASGSYADVGRFLLSLSTSDKFSAVKLRQIAPPSGTSFGYSFSIDVNLVDTIFKKQQ
jgi:Tfp pilus assembly protein PilN